MARGNAANLAQNREFSPEQRRIWASNAGKANARKQRALRTQREILRDLLRDALVETGMEPSIANAINFAVLRKAQLGDIEAARYVRDTIGEKPTETTALQISNQPIRAMDLTQLSDAELEALADRADEED